MISGVTGKSRSRFSKQQLIIAECQLGDSGTYTCLSGDVVTKAQLVVKGKKNFKDASKILQNSSTVCHVE